jgi:oligosaccharide repeat unit polymerase
MFSLIKGMEKEMIRHFVYALSGEISTEIFTRRWYIYNLGIAIIILSSFFAATYISVVKDKKSFERLISYIPFVSVILFILPEMSRGRLLDVILIYTFMYLFLRYTKVSFLKVLHKDYKLLVFLSTILIVPTALITKTRGIVFSENLILNVFYQVENYFAVSIIAFNEYLTSFQEKIGMRAIFYPAYYLLERIGIISVGSNVDPTQLTEFITYPTPTYLYWLHSGYGWFGIITVSFFIGIISTYFYMMFMRNRNIGSLWFLVSSYLVIFTSYATWRLYDLWFWIVLCFIIPITKLIELKSPLRQDR